MAATPSKNGWVGLEAFALLYFIIALPTYHTKGHLICKHTCKSDILLYMTEQLSHFHNIMGNKYSCTVSDSPFHFAILYIAFTVGHVFITRTNVLSCGLSASHFSFIGYNRSGTALTFRNQYHYEDQPH